MGSPICCSRSSALSSVSTTSRYPDLVGGVTREHVEAAAAAVLDRPGYTLVTAGPELSAPGPN